MALVALVLGAELPTKHIKTLSNAEGPCTFKTCVPLPQRRKDPDSLSSGSNACMCSMLCQRISSPTCYTMTPICSVHGETAASTDWPPMLSCAGQLTLIWLTLGLEAAVTIPGMTTRRETFWDCSTRPTPSMCCQNDLWAHAGVYFPEQCASAGSFGALSALPRQVCQHP